MKEMGRKKLVALFMIAVAVVVGYNIYQSKKTTDLSSLTMANIEALANSDEVKLGYERTTAQCPPPISYKTSVSCSTGGDEQDCSPSDC